MRKLTNARLVSRRLADEWKLLSSVFIGILVAVTISVGSTVYLTALEQLAFKVSLNQITAPLLNLSVYAKRIPLTSEAVDNLDELVTSIATEHIEDLYAGHEMYLRGTSSIVGTDEMPLPDVVDADSIPEEEARPIVWDGFFHTLTNLKHHAVFLEGRAASEAPIEVGETITVEATISEQVADESKLGPGDTVEVAIDVFVPTRINVRIVGVFQADDLKDEYWTTAALVLTSQSAPAQGGEESGFPPPDGVAWDENQDLAIGLFVPKGILTEVIGPAYERTLVNPIVFGKIDKEKLGNWTAARFVQRLDRIEDDVTTEIAGATLSSGTVRGLIANVGRRVFFSRIPLLFLLTIMVVTVLFYMTMMVSYLAKSRERDSALMRTRGVGLTELLRLYTIEGIVMCLLAFILGPLIAFSTIAVIGLVPPFRETTGAELLLVRAEPLAFAIGAGVALLCLFLYVAFGAAGARSGLLVQKARAARPASMSFFHRYYLDVGLVVIGGLVFWELQSREQIVSSGLFTELQVNETLLFGPILFLIVVALFFMRLFPLFVRYIGGESPGIVHLLTGLSVVGLAGGSLFFGYQDGTLSEAYVPAAIAVAVGAAYYVTHRFINGEWKWIGVGAQAVAVAAYVLSGDIQPSNTLFIAEIGLLAMVPAQALYRLLALITRSAPAWLSISLWHMARNPLQYTWLVLLLVLVTGLGIFATTVGGTLTRSQDEQIQFETPTDMRIQGTPLFLREGLQGMLDDFAATPAIDSGALGYRTSASLGNVSMQLLALEPQEYAEIAWFRDDFADTGLDRIMSMIEVTSSGEGMTLPADTRNIAMWIKPLEPQPLMSVWVVVQDSAGVVKPVSLGDVGELEWHKLSKNIPEELTGPIDLMAVSLYEPGTATQTSGGGTPGTVLFDDIHVVRSDGSEVIMEGFEGDNAWSPIPTNIINSDVLFTSAEDAFAGQRSGVFRFGTDRNRSVRGIYDATDGGVIPVVISRGVSEVTGLHQGMSQIVSVSGWLVPIEVAGIIDLFPTLDTTNAGFMLADLDALLSYMNMMSQITSVEPNELYLQKSGEAPDTIEEITNELESILLKVSDTTAQREEIRRDPLQNAGWRALVFMALAVVLLSAIFGYVAYILLVGESNEHEMGFLQSLGLSRFQLLGLLSFEHLTVVALGLGVGTWAGFQMSRLMVAPLAVSDIGQSIVPPFILVTDWSLMLPTYALILAIFMTVMLVLYRSIGRTKLFELARGVEA